ncbi:P-loop containing nucleoside triphosphate hydrolase protein [Paraphysoderma sedebokerense]|nr:P-loop containing nucleoside triphosphate hydrolase protein [Paraphysoderma sedebokerense]KAI9144429.1 P-loop containing nucleoside triphosphate hydrolase protein [Paraphysoderma sedebokerense]
MTTPKTEKKDGPDDLDSQKTGQIVGKPTPMGDHGNIKIFNPNLLSDYTGFWMNSIIRSAKNLDEGDLTMRDSEDALKNYEKFRKNWEKEMKDKPNGPSLWMALFRTFGWSFLYTGVFKLIWGALLLVNSYYFVLQLVAFLEDKQAPSWIGWVYAVAFWFGCFLFGIAGQRLTNQSVRLGLRVRAALSIAVYRKSLHIAPSVNNNSVNLIASDCQKFIEGVQFAHQVWSCPLECIAVLVLLYILVKEIAFSALAFIAVVLPLQFWLGKRISTMRKRYGRVNDERVGTMQELINGIKIVKFYVWEKLFDTEIRELRRKEGVHIITGGLIKTVTFMLMATTPVALALIIFGQYAVTVGPLKSAISFTTLSILNTVRLPLLFLPAAMRGVAECLAAVERINEFLLLPECPQVDRKDDGSIVWDNASFTYTQGKGDPLLKDVSISLPPGKLIALVGPVASGKTTLINSILGQAIKVSGSLSVSKNVTYVPQQHWLQHATIKENILFGSPYDEARYKRTLFACALLSDLKMMKDGDETEIYERGVNLSGGQRQRISLARAVYKAPETDVIILDSVLSAVDQTTAEHIFEYCINGLLKDKTVIMVTHQLGLVKKCDYVIAMRDCKILAHGESNSQEVLQRVAEFAPSNEPGHADSESSATSQAETISTLPSLTFAEMVKKADEILAATPSLHVENISIEPESNFTGFDGFLGFFRFCHITSSWKIDALFYIIAIYVISQSVRIFADYWVRFWVRDSFAFSDKNIYIYGYAAICFTFSALLMIRGAFIYYRCRIGGNRLHSALFQKILYGSLFFFNVTPTGRLINLFSKDMDVIDQGLPDSLHTTGIYLFILITTIVGVVIVLPLYLIVVAVLIIGFYILVKYYVPAARALKKATTHTADPLFEYASETCQGLDVIRAFQLQNTFETTFVHRLNKNTIAVYNSESAKLWLAFRVDLLASLLVFATCAFCVVSQNDANFDSTTGGLAVVNSFQKFVYFTWLCKGFADIKVYLGSVEKFMNYLNFVPTEGTGEKEIQTKETRDLSNWPTKGLIQFEDVVLHYAPQLPPVLKGVNFTINHCQKVGIVGRTGSGKSTTLLALFRMFEAARGKIIVDGIDISTLSLDELRRKLAIIPQEPVIFKGTIRSNLDLFKQYTDQQIWDALKVCHLKELVENLPAKLDTQIDDGGNLFSLGQKQLICICRCVLKKTNILLLDEATSAMDSQTDALIQKTISEVFADRTVITIAHRLDTIIKSDQIIVMDGGKVAEMGSPANLLRKENGAFAVLVEKTGAESSRTLKALAFAHEANKA